MGECIKDKNSVENQGFFQITKQHLIHRELGFLMTSDAHSTKRALKRDAHLTECALKREITVLQRANLRCRTFDYKPGDQILILTNYFTALQDCGIGPFTITQVHTNGTITFQRTPHIVERINIRRVKPYRD